MIMQRGHPAWLQAGRRMYPLVWPTLRANKSCRDRDSRQFAPVELDRALPYLIVRMVCSENLQVFGIMPREPKMRLIAFIVASIAAVAPAAAQGWAEYAYPGDAFTVAFPANPKVETTTYQAADGRQAEARVYSVAQDNALFRMTVADLPAMEEAAVIDHAIKTVSEGGEIKVDIPHRISRMYGRQLSIVGPEGSRSTVAAFYHTGRLYLIEGKVFPSGLNATSDLIRFQQSLVFTDEGTNRSQ
jgi:hypothetical protein